MSISANDTDWMAAVESIVRLAPKLRTESDSLAAQVRLLALLGSAAPLNVLLDGLAGYVEAWAQGVLCSVYLANASGDRLMPAAAPSLPAEYVRCIGEVPISAGRGSCGTAAALREMVIVDDIERSPLWSLARAIAMSHGLRACWSVPFFDDAGGLLGTLAVYHRAPRQPSSLEIDLTRFAASLAAFVIQRHRDNEKLRSNEARLHAAVVGARIGVWDSDLAGTGVWYDNSCERIGIDPCDGADQVRRWRAQIHPDDIERYTTSDQRCISGEAESYVVEYRALTRHGEWCWLQERGNVTARGADGLPTHYVGVCFAITEQRRIEAALRAAEDRFRLAIDAARLPMWEYDVVNDVVSGNIYWHRTVGYDLTEEGAAKRRETWLSDVHPDDAARHDRIYAGPAADATGFYENEFRIRRPDGEYMWLLDRARVVERDPAGAPLRVVGVSLDIDTRKRMESALRKSRESLETALWGAQSAYWTIDLVANRTEMSESFFTMTGIDPSTWDRGDAWCAGIHPEDAPMACARYRAHLEGRTEAYEHEYRLWTRGGWRWFQDRGRVADRDSSGRPLRISGTTMDVSARKQVEREIVEAVNREQRRIGHELHDGIGQRLAGISMLLDAAAGRVRKGLPQAAKELEGIAAEVREAIEETRALVCGVLPASIQRGEILAALQALALDISRTHQISIGWTLDGWRGQSLSEQAAQHVYRIAQEALNNAGRHASATVINLTLGAQNGILSLMIEDNGIGMGDSDRESMGNGLKIMGYRAQILGGFVSVEAGSGRGTRITLRCPLQQAETRRVPFTLTPGSCDCADAYRPPVRGKIRTWPVPAVESPFRPPRGLS